MKKIRILIFSVLAMMLFLSFNAFAATGWRTGSGRNFARWWYATDEAGTSWYAGTKEKPFWKKINGKWYAFDEDGWMYASALTPDGYTVLANGSWDGNESVAGKVTSDDGTDFTLSYENFSVTLPDSWKGHYTEKNYGSGVAFDYDPVNDGNVQEIFHIDWYANEADFEAEQGFTDNARDFGWHNGLRYMAGMPTDTAIGHYTAAQRQEITDMTASYDQIVGTITFKE